MPPDPSCSRRTGASARRASPCRTGSRCSCSTASARRWTTCSATARRCTTSARSAVSIATRREIYERLEGLDPAFGDLALVDYCIRGGDAGLRTVIVPDARVRIATEATNDLAAIRRLRARWSATARRRPVLQPALPDRPRRLPAGLVSGSATILEAARGVCGAERRRRRPASGCRWLRCGRRWTPTPPTPTGR